MNPARALLPALLPTLLLAAEAPPAQPTPAWDPLRGIEASGRIPRVPLPADIERPERWRYIPEGRIAPGTFFERFLVTAFATPIVYYQEDIGAGGGVGITDIDFRHQRRREFLGAFASRSTEGQEDYTAVWKRALHHRDLPAGGVLVEERGWLRAQGGYQRSRTRRFFGIGPDTRARDETSYTDEVASALLLVQRGLRGAADDWVLTAGLRGEHRNLARGRVSDRLSAGAAFPVLVADADGRDALWGTAGLRWDTRDSQHNAYRGGHLGAVVDAAAYDGGETGAIAELRGGWVWPVPSLFHDGGDPDEESPPTDTVVVGAFVQDTVGDLPFPVLPSLGGPDTLRGFIANRFTDRAAWHAAIEWRTWPIPRGVAATPSIRLERLGLALFYELGSVAEGWERLDGATVHDAYGIGFRLAFERAAVFRIDVGRSREDTAVSATFGMSL